MPRRSSHRVEPGHPVRLGHIDPDETEGYESKEDVQGPLDAARARIAELQERLFAEKARGVLVIFQALDAGGKDGAIKNCFRGVDPQGCVVWPFGVPTEQERAHDFLWRYHAKGPERGRITIFNRSYYEDVVVPRVREGADESVWRPRYRVIREFERGLAGDGFAIIKFFLHISRDEQKRRLERRLHDPAKRWKFSPGDLDDRARWDDYQAAYEDVLDETTSDDAPWFVVPANRKWFRNLVVARTVAATLEAMDPQYPPSDPALERIQIPD